MVVELKDFLNCSKLGKLDTIRLLQVLPYDAISTDPEFP